MNLIQDLLAGNRRALARTITLVENDGPEARELLAALYPRTGQAHIIGITGAPGTGKSTLVNVLARAYRRLGHTVGIVAVDPTSPFTGGALLGDRVRMRDLSGDAGVFIRSMATRGSLGGLAQATADVILVLDAAGFSRIIVETVGVGQAEVDIASTAHSTVVIEAPGLGDEVQAIKAGVLEIADILAVNKADRPGAEKTVLALQMMLGSVPSRTSNRDSQPWPTGTIAKAGHAPGPPPDAELAPQNDDWQPPIVTTVALKGEGIDELLAVVEQHRDFLLSSGQLRRREEERARSSLLHILQVAVLRRLQSEVPAGQMQDLIAAVADREIDPYTAAARLLPLLSSSG